MGCALRHAPLVSYTLTAIRYSPLSTVLPCQSAPPPRLSAPTTPSRRAAHFLASVRHHLLPSTLLPFLYRATTYPPRTCLAFLRPHLCRHICLVACMPVCFSALYGQHLVFIAPSPSSPTGRQRSPPHLGVSANWAATTYLCLSTACLPRSRLHRAARSILASSLHLLPPRSHLFYRYLPRAIHFMDAVSATRFRTAYRSAVNSRRNAAWFRDMHG